MGTQLAHTVYGGNQGSYLKGKSQIGTFGPTEIGHAPPGGMPYDDSYCSANNGACQARRLKTGELCLAHQKQLDKALAVEQG